MDGGIVFLTFVPGRVIRPEFLWPTIKPIPPSSSFRHGLAKAAFSQPAPSPAIF